MANKAKSVALSRGYVRSIMGRHIRFPNGQFTHKASGLIYQSTSADLNKINIITVSKFLRENIEGSRLLLNIHDEYSMSVPLDCDWDHWGRQLRDAIQDSHKDRIRIPIRLDFSELAANWWLATKAPILRGDV
jgi:DNA polymerase I-like protein with 3'-5' exonuclease and polymerase domains